MSLIQSTRGKLGTLSAVKYFQNADGHLQLPPTHDTPCPAGYDIRYADDLSSIDRLQRQLGEQDRRDVEQKLEKQDEVWAERYKRTTDNLYRVMTSGSTSEYEREFIRLYLQLREEKRSKFQSKFYADQAFFSSREQDESTIKAQIEDLKR